MTGLTCGDGSRRTGSGGYLVVTWWLPGGYLVLWSGGYLVVTWWLAGGYLLLWSGGYGGKEKKSICKKMVSERRIVGESIVRKGGIRGIPLDEDLEPLKAGVVSGAKRLEVSGGEEGGEVVWAPSGSEGCNPRQSENWMHELSSKAMCSLL